MTNTTYYNLNIVEGTDIVNPLTVDNPNYEKIDEVMHDNAVAGVTLATELTNATIHALTRENSDCSVIRFIATSQWKAGDSVTVDGVPVLALLPSGETLPDGAYVINANVLCVLTGTNLTVYASKNAANASEIPYNDTNVKTELDNLNTSVQETKTSVQEISNNLNLDYSNARADVQDLNTFLQKTLLLLFPKALCKYVVTSTGVTTTDYGCKIVTYDYTTSTSSEVIVAGPLGTTDSGWHDNNILVTYDSGNYTISAYRNVVINNVPYTAGTAIKTWHYTTAVNEEYTVNE